MNAPTYIWWDEPANVSRIAAYCDQDVETETEIDGLLPPLTAAERDVWMLDQRINDRGIKLDIPTIERVIAVKDIAKRNLDRRMKELTGGAVSKCSEVGKLVAWIAAQGVPCESIAKGEQEELIADTRQHDALFFGYFEGRPRTVGEAVRIAIELRQDASKTSTAKFDAMLACVCSDGRARGLLAYHGTNTGRWAGRLIQPQNLYRIDFERDGEDIMRAVDVLLAHTPQDAHDMLAMLFGSVMTMLAKVVRAMIVAEYGNSLKGADLANIEGRLQAWIAGEEWKIEAFRAFDAGTGPDLYCVAYGKAFGEEPAAVKKQKGKRQIGKVMELSAGYQGSVGSFINMGKNYGLKPAPLVPIIQQVALDRWLSWCDRYAGARDKRGLPMDQWAAVKTIVQGWREQHPRIVQAWWDVQDAAIDAVANPGQVVPVLDGKVAYMAARGFLWCRLPSGRVLAYCNPRVVQTREAWLELPDGTRIESDELFEFEEAAHIAAGAVKKERIRRRVDYDGYDGEHRRWTTFSLYGGMQFNHIVQGTARDVLVGGMLRAEAAGYVTVLTVHDEVLCESPFWHGSVAELEALLTAGEPWLAGCPLAAAGWEGARYGK